MTDTKAEDQREQELESEQVKQLKEAMIAQGLPKSFVDSIPAEKLNDPDFLQRAVAAAQGLPIPTKGAMKSDEVVSVSPPAGMPSMGEIMELAAPLLQSFKDEMEKSAAELARMKAGLKVMFDSVQHLVSEVHAMNEGCLLSAKKAK